MAISLSNTHTYKGSTSYLLCHFYDTYIFGNYVVTQLNLLFGKIITIIFKIWSITKVSEVGGKRIHPLGSGDDDANLEDDFITWKEAFWASVCAELDIEASSEEFNTRQFDFKKLEVGVYRVPYNLIFFPTMIFFYILIFFPKMPIPFPFPY